MRVHAHGYRDVVDLGVGEQELALHFPRIQRLAAHAVDRLVALVARLLGRAARRVALDQVQLVVVHVGGLAVGQLLREDHHARGLPALDFLHRAQPLDRLLDDQVGDFFAVLDVAVHPQRERVAHHFRDQLHRVAVGELLLGLAVELRLQHFRREKVDGA
ncbi:hypothetical protein D3C83_00450 [compost metagenome]